MFFVTADVRPGQSFGEVLESFGLDDAQQLAAIRDSHNAQLHRNAGGMVPDGVLRMRTVQPATVVVPIDPQLSVNEYRPVIDLANGLRPRRVGDTSAPTCTHGVAVRIGRNLGAGTSLNWIQTVRKLNNPDRAAPIEFVDVGHNNQPFSIQPPAGQPADVEFGDTPCGPAAPGPGRGVDFTAMTTLAVLARGHVILAAGKVWRFVINPHRTLPQGVTATPPRDAVAADFQNQLRILRLGLNQFRQPTGATLDYVVQPAMGSVVP
jgi:hypothetical protein